MFLFRNSMYIGSGFNFSSNPLRPYTLAKDRSESCDCFINIKLEVSLSLALSPSQELKSSR